MIKTIVFDLGNVLVPFDFKPAYARLEPLCAYPAAEIPSRIRPTDLVWRFETGKVPPEQFFEELAVILELKMTYPEFRHLWNSVFLTEPLVPESLVAGLGGRYRLMVLSNTNAIHFPILKENYPLLRHFDDYVLSYEVGAVKPSAKMFEAAIARAGCGPGECFFTDDIAVNVEAARQHGMDAVQFQSARQLEEELRARGVL